MNDETRKLCENAAEYCAQASQECVEKEELYGIIKKEVAEPLLAQRDDWKRKAEEAQTDKLLICDWMKRERAAEIRGLRRALNFANESYKDKRHEQLFLTEQAWEEATEKVINFCEDEIKKLEAK